MRWSYAIVVALCVCALGCDEVAVEPLRPGSDGGFMEGPPPGCEDLWPAVTVFANNCAVSGACHVPGGQYPDLTRAGLYDLVGAASEANPAETLVVANDPEASWLYRKMSGTQGEDGGLLMPMGSDEPIDAVGTIAGWINAGAPTACDGEEPPSPPVPVDPNALDQGELFTCDGPPDTGSVSRIRRVERTMWTHSTGNTLGSGAHQNPLYAPEGQYSTYSEDVTVDPSTLDLYMTVLPRAGSIWRGRESFPRLWPVYSEPTIRCIYGDSEPDDECIDFYVDTLLTAGVMFRTPTDGERAQVREYLVEQMATEDGSTTRSDTLTQVASAAWLMSGALFRPELGEPVEEDPTGRRRLTDDELALALGNLLSTHPPGSALPTSTEDRGGEPDASNPELGYLGQIRQAADDGTISDPEVIRALIRTYRGGVDEGRADIFRDIDGRDIPSRGEYWLAPRIRGFFREWLDYETANTAFKDTPTATTAYEGHSQTRNTFGNLQHGYYGYESRFVGQMDDTIARAVLDAESGGQDVYRALLTTRLWRLPSNIATSNSTPCSSDADCSDSTYSRCQSATGLCSSSISNNTSAANYVYGLDFNIPATQEGRWVEMPEGQRAGVLTHPAWLIAHGGNFEDDASAVLRGRWIREHLYCETVPGLDLVRVEAQLVDNTDGELRARDRIRMSIEEGEGSATCMGCHRLMNSLGMPFETFNHAGIPRDDDHGMPPDGSSTIDVAPDPSLAGDVSGPVELSQMLADSPYARRCFIRHVFRYFMGRDENIADACTLTAMEAAFEGGSFFDLLEALATSDSFLYSRIEGGAP